MEEANLYRERLREELTRRKIRNPSYSLRAFARDLGLSPTALCDVLSAKRDLSRRNVQKVAEALGLAPSEAQLWTGRKGRARRTRTEFLKIEEDSFRLISEWYHFAILSLARISSNRATDRWISERLGISRTEARGAIRRLCRLKLLEVKKGKLVRTSSPLTTSTGVPSYANRHYHRQNLELAALSLSRDRVEERENSAVTMAIDPRRLAEAKRRIERFRIQLSNFLEGGQPLEVYSFALQLFPATLNPRRS